MQHNIVRIPKTEEKLIEMLNDYSAYLDNMYTELDEKIHGPMNFQMDHWIFLWTQGTGFFITSETEQGELRAVMMCTQYTDMWSSKVRLDIHRYAVYDDGTEWDEHLFSVIEYLDSVSSVLNIEEIYVTYRLEDGSEIKELKWSS